MSQWLGIGILVGFSLALSLFMRLERKPRPEVPAELRAWSRAAARPEPDDTYLETRVVELPGRGFKAARWVQQRRIRRTSDQSIVEVLPERPFRPRT